MQLTIALETINEYVSDNNHIHAIDDFVENLDLEKADFIKQTPYNKGRSAYNPKQVIILY